MFNSLQDKLDKALHNISGRGKITEINVAETVKEIRRALVDADVNYKVAKDLTKRVQDKALGQNVLTSLTPGQLMTKIVHDELVDLMGGTQEGINLSGKPAVILIAGLQGSGKTTFSGKLANYLKVKRHKKPLLVACDVYRPAAIDQLKVLGSQIDVPVYTEEGATNPSAIAENAIKYAKENNFDVVIIDTAGRLQNRTELMDELAKIVRVIRKLDQSAPHDSVIVLDGTVGQNALSQVKAFQQAADVSGLIVTKLDGSAKGGVVVALAEEFGLPVHAVGVGEGADDLQPFDAQEFANALTGVADRQD